MKQPIWAVVPYKGTANSKQRLAFDLSERERAGLVHAMLDDVLSQLSQSRLFDGILLVSRAPDASSICTRYGIELFRDRATNLPDALVESSSWLLQQDTKTVFIVPTDVPLLTIEDLTVALSKHRQVTVIPDQHEIGTNGLICTPPNAFPYVFDGQSFNPHMRGARAEGLDTHALHLPSFSLDVDTAEDMHAVIKSDYETRTKTYLLGLTSLRKLA